MGSFEVIDLGRMSYGEALAVQLRTVEEVLAGQRSHTLLLVEHEPVLTLGASFLTENLLLSTEEYKRLGVQIEKTDRGGDVTYHGPGQLVAYPIFNVALLGKDLHKWMRDLEQSVMYALQEFGVVGERLDVNSGVWVNQKKICAIGIKIRRWVSLHGIAVNCDVDLAPFTTIVPCGIKSHGVTTVSRETDKAVTIEEFKTPLIRGISKTFNLKIGETSA